MPYVPRYSHRLILTTLLVDTVHGPRLLLSPAHGASRPFLLLVHPFLPWVRLHPAGVPHQECHSHLVHLRLDGARPLQPQAGRFPHRSTWALQKNRMITGHLCPWELDSPNGDRLGDLWRMLLLRCRTLLPMSSGDLRDPLRRIPLSHHRDQRLLRHLRA